MVEARATLQTRLAASIEAKQVLLSDSNALATFEALVKLTIDTYKSGGRLYIAGNGGSAADAQHLAAEFVSRLAKDRAPLPAEALTVDTSILTAIGNDYGFEQVFERQVRGLGKRGDGFLAFSTSGRSSNILAALRAAHELGITTMGFTGAEGNLMSDLCDVCLFAPTKETPLIQQIHITAAHIVCNLVECSMFGRPF